MSDFTTAMDIIRLASLSVSLILLVVFIGLIGAFFKQDGGE